MKDEGVIKYSQVWKRNVLPSLKEADALLAIRDALFRRHWIGTDADGVGFGNVSVRLPDNAFLITASQTGHIPHLSTVQLSMVTAVDINENTLWCTGLMPASSEAMSHAAIYAVKPDVHCVIHVHDAELWNSLIHVAPTTDAGIPYGTPDMAYALQELILDMEDNELIVMGGHPNGIISAGSNTDDAWQTLQNWSAAGKDRL